MVDKSFVEQKKPSYPEPTPVGSFDIEKHGQAPVEVPSTPEQPQVPEQVDAPEVPERHEAPSVPEQPPAEDVDSSIKSLKRKLRKTKKKQVVMPAIKDEITLRIEKVMEEGIDDAYRELTPIQKQEFKMKGEETAFKIRELMKKTHVKIKDIFRLLYEWLRMLPGVNKFFLEQEAKIKADRIIAIKDVSDIK